LKVTLIHQLLDMSRKAEAVNSAIRVQHLLEKVLDFFSLQKKNLKIQITTDFKATIDTVAVHEDQLRQVFLNCLMNATDAIEEKGEEGQGKIEIICENVIVEEEKSVQVRIIDNGPGVDSSHIDNIFDPFFTTKEIGKGTGLGLYVSYTIMENLGGSLKFNNLQPVGAEIVIWLPCIEERSV
jgi:signal transduction histidine kinase